MSETESGNRFNRLEKDVTCKVCGSWATVPVTMLGAYHSVLCQDCRNDFDTHCDKADIMAKQQDLEVELQITIFQSGDISHAQHVRGRIREEGVKRRNFAKEWVLFQHLKWLEYKEQEKKWEDR